MKWNVLSVCVCVCVYACMHACMYVCMLPLLISGSIFAVVELQLFPLFPPYDHSSRPLMRCGRFRVPKPFLFDFFITRGTDAPMLPVPTLSGPLSCVWAVAGPSKMSSRFHLVLQSWNQLLDSPSRVSWVSCSTCRMSSSSVDVVVVLNLRSLFSCCTPSATVVSSRTSLISGVHFQRCSCLDP
jgi:hypothetical protein